MSITRFTKARPNRCLGGVGGIPLVELLKDVLSHLGGDAAACVPYPNHRQVLLASKVRERVPPGPVNFTALENRLFHTRESSSLSASTSTFS